MLAPFSRYRFDGFDDAPAEFARVQPRLAFETAGLPPIHEYRDALYVPLRGGPERPVGGLFGAGGEPIAAGLHCRGEDVHFGATPPPAGLPRPARTIDAEVLYLGRAFPHFGHLVFEGLARAFAIAAVSGDTKLLFHGLLGYPARQHARLLLSGVGATPERMLYGNEPLRIRRLLVPEPGIVYARSVHRELAATYVAARERLGVADAPETEQPLYLSRAGLPRSQRRVLEEAAFEDWLRAQGFAVMRPELHGLREQIAAVHRHRHVFGFWGSALRLAFFSDRRKLVASLHDEFPRASSLQDALLTGNDAWLLRGCDADAGVGGDARWRYVQSLRVDEVCTALAAAGFARATATPPPRASAAEIEREAAFVAWARAAPAAAADEPAAAPSEAELRRGLAEDPWDFRARVLLAHRCRASGRHREAVEHAEVAALLNPHDAGALELLETARRDADRRGWLRRLLRG